MNVISQNNCESFECLKKEKSETGNFHRSLVVVVLNRLGKLRAPWKPTASLPLAGKIKAADLIITKRKHRAVSHSSTRSCRRSSWRTKAKRSNYSPFNLAGNLVLPANSDERKHLGGLLISSMKKMREYKQPCYLPLSGRSLAALWPLITN